ncbi:MAG: tetratricopeptide repeat protein [Bacteroidota bacterium]|nr:tetratricopeptide repeat protein [Bacteroidota bacterium]
MKPKKYILILIYFLFTSLLNAQDQDKIELIQKGNLLYKDSAYDEAAKLYQRSLNIDGGYFKAAFNLADALYKQGLYNESSNLFNQLKSNKLNNKELSSVYHNLGNSKFMENKFEDAIAAYKESLRINPNDNETRYNLALSKKMLKDQKDQKDQKEQEKQDQKDQKDQKNQKQQKEQKEQREQKEQKSLQQKNNEKILDAINEEEKETLKKLKKVKNKKNKKDW